MSVNPHRFHYREYTTDTNKSQEKMLKKRCFGTLFATTRIFFPNSDRIPISAARDQRVAFTSRPIKNNLLLSFYPALPLRFHFCGCQPRQRSHRRSRKARRFGRNPVTCLLCDIQVGSTTTASLARGNLSGILCRKRAALGGRCPARFLVFL